MRGAWVFIYRLGEDLIADQVEIVRATKTGDFSQRFGRLVPQVSADQLISSDFLT